MTENRLSELETRLTFQEDLIQELNKIVADQQIQIEKLETACRVLLSRIQDQSEAAPGGSLQDDIPPHY